MTLFLLFLLASSGLTIIITKSYIFKWLRDFFDVSKEVLSQEFKGVKMPFRALLFSKIHKLLSCPLCFGFWAGLVVYFAMKNEYGVLFCYCLSASVFSFIIYSVVDR
tara:strand:+ start:1874 stop:2194 length:321 start_codon:yes stop_codon:yes gene_type:complete